MADSEYTYQYYGTDFDVRVTLKDIAGATIPVTNPFRCIFKVGNVSFTCYYDGENYVGCTVNNTPTDEDYGIITCHVDANHFGCGHLYMTYIEYADNALFVDGNKKFSAEYDTKVILWDDVIKTDQVNIEIVPNYVVYELYSIVKKYADDNGLSICDKDTFYQELIKIYVKADKYNLSQSVTANSFYAAEAFYSTKEGALRISFGGDGKSFVFTATDKGNLVMTIPDTGENYILHDGSVKTINGESIVGSGDISVATPSDISSLKTTMQTADIALDSEIKSVESELQAEIDAKQNVLQSGVNIKTINNQSLLGRGNITIQGGGGGGSVTCDDDMDATSTNPITNMGITRESATLLASMGLDIDNIDSAEEEEWDYVPDAGDYYFVPAQGKIYYATSATSSEAVGVPRTDRIYTNNHTGYEYRWTGSAWYMLSLGVENADEVTDKDLYVYTAQQVDTKVDSLAQDLGTLASLETTAKTSAVDAINELYDTIGNVASTIDAING